jgi:hypothetical protein
MPSNEYHFITYWRVKATLQEVYDILQVPTELPRWWPSVYLDAVQLVPGDKTGLGMKVHLYTKGWLPYTLTWDFEITQAGSHGFTLTPSGDFIGRGIWTFKEADPYVDITYDWKISATKPILKRLSFLLKPVFSMNHLWAMKNGEISLKLELERRRATTTAEKALIPAPPPATPTAIFPFLAVALRLKRSEP